MIITDDQRLLRPSHYHTEVANPGRRDWQAGGSRADGDRGGADRGGEVAARRDSGRALPVEVALSLSGQRTRKTGSTDSAQAQARPWPWRAVTLLVSRWRIQASMPFRLRAASACLPL